MGLSDSPRRLSTTVHRLVALAFIGPAPSRIHEINHKNGIKTDNRVDNLEWVTCAENIAHAVRLGLRADKRGVLNGRAKLTADDAAEIRMKLGNGTTYDQVAKEYGIGKSQVWNVKARRAWGERVQKDTPTLATNVRPTP